MNTRSIHFSERAEPRANGSIERPAKTRFQARTLKTKNTPAQPNVITAFGTSTREAALILEKLKRIVFSSNRHGDLCVARGAGLRLIEALDVLIAHEEQAVGPVEEDAPSQELSK